MDTKEFSRLRKQLNKTQKEMAQLLGTSIKAVHSYEQGWRTIPHHVERQMYFLVTRLRRKTGGQQPCWKIMGCTSERRSHCPAWEFNAGDLCWFINGTICEGRVHKNWREKMKSCRSCKVLTSHICS
ncbi:MAG: helix-turn-helix transcriptional regulator [Deltaproteobacteria bacterium]|nr:helix-turn-helix transcriptional regulator [Deltaproteobacteria bacterium]MBW2151503.1 helix-turn-helix transcriptional regulator [Deltaproteobacteria bacterium]